MAPRRTKILVVDNDPARPDVLKRRLQEWGCNVNLASSGREAKKLIEKSDPDLVIADISAPESPGLELIRSLKTGNLDRSVILITGDGSVDLAVEAMKRGAHDFITKPIDFPQLKTVVEEIQKDIELRRQSQKLSARLEKGAGFGPFIGISKKMRQVYRLVKTLGESEAPAIITGESGTGKELAARLIHELSPRSQESFIAINAAAIPENLIEDEIFGHEKGAFTGATSLRPGCFEMAHGGTLFFDEIAEMPLVLQPKLLRVLQDGRVRRLGGKREFTFDVRVIAATNQNPTEALEAGSLREDLYYRLSVFTIAIPPLRDRKGDIPLLVQHFIAEFNQKHDAKLRGIREEALASLNDYSWPGNVRELRNVIERAVILAKDRWIEPSHIPRHIRDASEKNDAKVILPIGVTLAEAEKKLILKTLAIVGNNKAEAARQLGLDVKTIYNKLKQYGVDPRQ